MRRRTFMWIVLGMLGVGAGLIVFVATRADRPLEEDLSFLSIYSPRVAVASSVAGTTISGMHPDQVLTYHFNLDPIPVVSALATRGWLSRVPALGPAGFTVEDRGDVAVIVEYRRATATEPPFVDCTVARKRGGWAARVARFFQSLIPGHH